MRLDQILDEVRREKTNIGRVERLISGIRLQVSDVLKGEKPQLLESVDAVFSGLLDGKTDIEEALSGSAKKTATLKAKPKDQPQTDDEKAMQHDFERMGGVSHQTGDNQK